MDSSPEERHSEEQDYTPMLSDDALLLIFLELNWRDINNLKLVSKRFYGIIHRNYHRLKRREVSIISVKNDRNRIRFPFYLKLTFHDTVDENFVSLLNIPYTKTINIQCDEELFDLLKVFDMRKLDKLYVLVDVDCDIIRILGAILQVGAKIEVLKILKLVGKDFESFRTLIGKFPSIKNLFIEHICASLTETKDASSLLSSLTSFNTIETSCIYECSSTNILSADMVTELLRRNSHLDDLTIGTGNIEFERNIFKGYFTLEQPRKMENECRYNVITLQVYFRGEYGLLVDTLKNCLSEIVSVVRVYSDPEGIKFESKVDCKYCFKNKHGILRSFFVTNNEPPTIVMNWD
uniref:F-box domain-containing protein n=1 Tax=Strongyloides venezuelensis TaxID=75913 RepID=A0A0K0FVK6_STRVS